MQNSDRKLQLVIVLTCLLGLALLIAPIVLFVRAMMPKPSPWPGSAPFSQQAPYVQLPRRPLRSNPYRQYAFPPRGHNRGTSPPELSLDPAQRSPQSLMVIPSGKTAYWDKDFREVRLRFFHRTMVSAYSQVGRHNPAWDAPALRYLDACARSSARMPDAQTPEALVHAGKALLDVGCTDPMVAYNHGINLYKSGQKDDARRYMLLAIDGFKICRYPRARTRAAAARVQQMDGEELANPAQGGGTPNLAREQFAMHALSLQWLGESLKDGSYTNSEQRLFFDQMDNEINETFSLQEVVDQVHTLSGVDPYILDILEGRLERNYAWGANNSGFSAGFQQHMAVARQKFITAWKLHPEYPEAPSAMISLAMAGQGNPGETVFTWFNRAVADQMDYQPAYYFLFASQRPNRGGSLEAVYRTGLACLATGRYDTGVPGYFVNALTFITDDSGGSLQYWQLPETYQHMQTASNGFLQLATSQQRRNEINSQYAAAALLCGHYADAQHLLDALGPQVNEQPFRIYAHCSLATARTCIKLHQPPDLRSGWGGR